MKKTILITMIATAVLLTGCSSNTASSSDASESSGAPAESQAAQTTEEAATTAELTDTSSQPSTAEAVPSADTAESSAPDTADTNEESGAFALTGPGGDVIPASAISRVDASDEDDYIANGISATNWRQVETSGFTYLAEPGGEYKRVDLGEMICGLTLFDAGCVFSAENKAESGSHADESFFSSSYAEFEGSVELSGTLTTAAGDSGLVEAGSVIFTPDEGAQLPIMNYKFDPDKGVYYPEDSMYPAIVVTGVQPQTEGEHVTITLSGISMSSSVDNFSIIRASAE